jgi:hypothetical protein
MTRRAAALALALLAGGGLAELAKLLAADVRSASAASVSSPTSAPGKTPGTRPTRTPGPMPGKPTGKIVRPPGSVPAPTDPWLVDPRGLWWFRSPVSVPELVFVSRSPAPGDHVIPGLGPHGRTLVTRGTLMRRTTAGAVHAFLREPDPFWDVADPAVSWDGRAVAFAAVTHRDSAWRIWTVGADGRGLRPVTRTDRGVNLAPLGRAASTFRRYDDVDPVWLPDGTLCFASTRFPQRAGEGEALATNLFVVRADGSGMRRLTTDRHGAEEPTVDPRTGKIVYARWWTNRHLASERSPYGITTVRALADSAEAVDLWHAITIDLDGDGAQLAGGYPRERAETMAYQPVVLDDGTLVGVRGVPGSLLREDARGVATWVQAYPGGLAAPRWVPGVRERRGAAAAPVRACAPAALGGRRVAIAADPRGRGDFGLSVAKVARPGADEFGDRAAGPASLVRLVDLPGTHELDPAVLAPRKLPPVLRSVMPPLPRDLPLLARADWEPQGYTFRFDCMNVFAQAPVDAPIPDAPPIDTSLAIRFYVAYARPEAAGGDSAALLREAPVYRAGGVHEDGMPADAPMFEQLVSAHGRTVRTVQGPAHVAGFNVGRSGVGTKCMGCHVGHSVIAVAPEYETAKRVNVSPSARVTASSAAAGTAGPRAAVDRRAKGPAGAVAWVAETLENEWIRLDFPVAVEVDSLILYALGAHSPLGTDVRVREVDLTFYERGRPTGNRTLRTELSSSGTPLACEAVRADAVVLRPKRASGRVLGRPRVAIAEIETRACIADAR